MTKKVDERVTKVKVTMRNAVAGAGGVTYLHEAVDYVDAERPGLLEAYVADAQTRWQVVEYDPSEKDAGPAGYNGATAIPEALNHPLAGTVFDATED